MPASPLGPKVIPSRRAAQSAARNIAQQLDSSEDDEESRPSPSRKSGGIKGIALGRRTTNVIDSKISSVSSSLAKSAAEGHSKKRQLTASSSSSELTDLSGEESPEHVPKSSFKHPSDTEGQRTPSRSRFFHHARLSSHSSIVRSSFSEDEHWSIGSLGTYIWVLVDTRGRVFQLDNEESGISDRIWWPAKIISKAESPAKLVVLLLGSLTPEQGHAISIESPSCENTLAMTNIFGAMRFEEPPFVGAESSRPLHGSPKKKQKRDHSAIEERWRTAVAIMLQHKEDDDDGLPEPGLAFTTYASMFEDALPPSDCMQMDGATADKWEPEGPDELMDIPGELILASDHRQTYWPARILGYSPPRSQLQKHGKYTVEYLDGKKKTIPRTKFFVVEDDQFATCKIGTFESRVADISDGSDSDSDLPSPFTSGRKPSPAPADSPPTPRAFLNLTIHEQFAYTKPVLQAVMNGTYAPAKKPHNDFISGGKARKSLNDTAALRGTMDPRQVKQLQKHLVEWCLRDEKWAIKIHDEQPMEETSMGQGSSTNIDEVLPEMPPPFVQSKASVNNNMSGDRSVGGQALSVHFDAAKNGHLEALTSSPLCQAITHSTNSNINTPNGSVPQRQTGCIEYEALSRIEKLDYCINVLLPEAIVQILIWRSGDRKSMRLLTDEEEVTMHKIGENKRNERDWVFDVMRLRAVQERQLAKRKRTGASVTKTAVESTGTRSRPGAGRRIEA